MVIVITEML